MDIQYPPLAKEDIDALENDDVKEYAEDAKEFMPQPEIHHRFREADPRPPATLSQAFTAICLLPLLILSFMVFFTI